MVGKAARKLIENIPRPFRRIRTAHDDKAKHMLALMSRPQYRRDHGTVLVQGLKTIQELRKQNVEVQTVIATAKTELQDIEVETHDPAKKILRNPDLIPAKNYYVTDVNLTRRILGTSSRPNAHEIYAEVKVPRMKESTAINAGQDEKSRQDDNETTTTTTATTASFITSETDKLLILDGLRDPGNIGSLVRTAMGLGWDKGFTTTGTCDLYNDKAVRASRALTILWQFKVIPRRELLKVLVENGFTPIAADMLPRNSTKLNTTTLHSLEDICSLCQQQQSLENAAQISEKSNSGAEGGLIFHNFQQNNTRGASLSHLLEKKKIALILSDEHHGLSANSLLDNVIKVSIPMDPRVESLNVAAAGSIIMSQLSAKFPFLSLKKST